MWKSQASFVVAVIVGMVGSGLAQDFEILLVTPPDVVGPPGTTYEVEVWGQFSGGAWVDGASALAAFGIDIICTGGRSLVSAVSSGWQWNNPIVLYDNGFPTGPDLLGVRGGQLANLFGFLNPNIDLSNPIQLFSFDVTITGEVGVIEYTPMNPAAEGGLSFYPDSTEGASIIAPNDPGTTLTLTGVRTLINVPGCGTFGVLGWLSVPATKRRR